MRARPIHGLAAILAAAVSVAPAQQPPSEPAYGYEVVSIHQAAPGQMNSGFSPGPQGGMRARNVTADQMLAFAYNVQDYQLAGVPGWARSERFEISFTPDRSEIVPGQETARADLDGWLGRQRQRMQAVLRDRFSLALRAETRELPIYVLTVAKGGPKLSAPVHPERTRTSNLNSGRQIVGTNAPVQSLAELLAMVLARPVHDKTGLNGAYDFKVDWSPDSATPSADDPEHASIFTALTEQLGLRLESGRGPVEVFVIEKIDRPSEN